MQKGGLKGGQRATPAQTEPVQTSTHKHRHQTHGQSGAETTGRESRRENKLQSEKEKVCVREGKKEEKGEILRIVIKML